jgi:hypothetical protein
MSDFLINSRLNKKLASFFYGDRPRAMLTPDAHAQTTPSTAIASSQTNACWDVQDYSTADGAAITMWPCTGTSKLNARSAAARDLCLAVFGRWRIRQGARSLEAPWD